MKIIDLTDENVPLYCQCLEDWSDEIRDAGDHKEQWYCKMKNKGLRVKLALDDKDRVGGMIQHLPIEQSFAEGKDLYFILCIWVHGHRKGRGNFQKKGFGKALLHAAEEDARSLGAKGMAAWGISLPFWMGASWFRKHGYLKADKDGIRVLLWKPFYDDAVSPQWIRMRKRPQAVPGKVTVTSFINGWCPGQNMVHERAKRAALEFGDKVIFKKVRTDDRETYLEWGISDALFIDEKEVKTGPPPSYENIKRKIQKRINPSRLHSFYQSMLVFIKRIG